MDFNTTFLSSNSASITLTGTAANYSPANLGGPSDMLIGGSGGGGWFAFGANAPVGSGVGGYQLGLRTVPQPPGSPYQFTIPPYLITTNATIAAHTSETFTGSIVNVSGGVPGFYLAGAPGATGAPIGYQLSGPGIPAGVYVGAPPDQNGNQALFGNPTVASGISITASNPYVITGAAATAALAATALSAIGQGFLSISRGTATWTPPIVPAPQPFNFPTWPAPLGGS